MKIFRLLARSEVCEYLAWIWTCNNFTFENNGLNSLKLTPNNWEEQLKEEKEEIERELNVGKNPLAQPTLENRLKKIDEQLRQLPYKAYEQLKDHYQKMVDK